MDNGIPARDGPAHAHQRWWTLGILAVVAFLATLDRQVFVVLLVPIQRQLEAGDAAMGFLMGSAFALAQALCSLPMGRLVDRNNRRNLLAFALAAWSLATLLGGLASTFAALLVARLAVGAAEAAQTPVTASLVGDLFARNERGTAFTFCSVGMALGVSCGSYAGGTLGGAYGWNVALLVAGAPGLVVACVLYLAVNEPPRAGRRVARAPALAWRPMAAQVLAIRTLPPFVIAFALLQGAVFAWFVWFPVLLMRVHGLDAAEMGAVFGTIVLCGTLSALLGGPLSDVVARRGARWRVGFILAVTGLSMPLMLASGIASSLVVAKLCAMGFTLVAGGHHPVAMAVYTSLSPPHLRGSVASLVYLVVTLVGAGAAPFAFGLVNDALRASHGDDAVRLTLMLAPVLLALAALGFGIALRTVDGDTAAAERAAVSSGR